MDRDELIREVVERTGIREEEAQKALDAVLESLIASAAEAKPAREVPYYFERYVRSEVRRLGEEIRHIRVELGAEIASLREEMITRFEEVDRRFEEVDRGFGEVDRRFGEVDRRFGEMDRRFERIDRWFLSVGIPIVLGILAIIAKIFFGR